MRKFIDIVESQTVSYFHGSLDRIETPYLPLTHFGTRNAAITRALYQAHQVNSSHIWIHEVSLAITEPLRIPDLDQHSIIKLIDFLHYDLTPRSKRFPIEVRNKVISANTTEAFAQATRAEGYDGFIYTNEHEDRGSSSLIIIESSQAKPLGQPIGLTFDEGMAIIQGFAK